ncbi:MAG: DUF3298 domain-containing protein [Firmicutes bacterium]|nr:DUF3298 domain-containing protein [Bacillota bacterium]
MQNRREDFDKLRREYEETEAPPFGLNMIKTAIERGKADRRKRKVRTFVRSLSACAAALVLGLFLLPRVSEDAAFAMSNMPILSSFVGVDASEEIQVLSADGRYYADVTIPRVIELDKGNQKSLYTETDSLQNINLEIGAITHQLIREFDDAMEQDAGSAELVIKYELPKTTEQYFVLKLITYVGSGSGYEKDYFYTFDQNSGKRIFLQDLFAEDSDYVGLISENIKEQMKSRMAADSEEVYWLSNSVTPELAPLAFDKIEENQAFYINEENQLVIAFSEGDVGPMAMGTVEFVIPSEVIEQIRL